MVREGLCEEVNGSRDPREAPRPGCLRARSIERELCVQRPEAGLCLGTDKNTCSGRNNREGEVGAHDPFFWSYGLDCQNGPRLPVTHQSLVGV